MEERLILSNELNERFVKWRNINRKFDRFLLFILLFMIVFIGSALMENWLFNIKGMDGMKYHDFDELLAINPDTVAWLTINKTGIDYPVVQGKDNFEYLDKAFTGEFSVGGTLFLDYQNNKQFKDRYNIIHGHHMTSGKMFGDLDKFLDKDFFTVAKTGTLLTPTYDYDLRIIAVGEFDAYDGEVYTVGNTIPENSILQRCIYKRVKQIRRSDQILALSTCTGDMSDNRIVVFCKMINKRTHE